MDTSEINSLAEFSVFNDVVDKEVFALLNSHPILKFSKGEVIVSRKMCFKGVIFIKNGLVKVSKVLNNKKEFILGIGSMGNIFGIESVVSNECFSKNIIAIYDSEVYFLTYETTLTLFKADKQILVKFLKEFSLNVKMVERNLYSILGKKICEHMAEILIMGANANDINNSNRNSVNLSIADISKIIGTTQNYAHKILNTFIKNSLIKMDNKSITILNIEKLYSIAGK